MWVCQLHNACSTAAATTAAVARLSQPSSAKSLSKRNTKRKSKKLTLAQQSLSTISFYTTVQVDIGTFGSLSSSSSVDSMVIASQAATWQSKEELHASLPPVLWS